MDKINKGAKYRKMAHSKEVPNPFFLRRPSGIMQLDIDTGGGFPAGGLSYISGPDSAGKTWLLYNLFAMHQRLYGEEASICYVPVEFLPDYKFMRQCGCAVTMPDEMLDEIDRDRTIRRLPKLTKDERTELQRQVGNFTILRGFTAEEILDDILEAYHSNAFHIIALDSVSALAAKVELDLDTLGDNPQQAANARILTRFMQHFHPLTMGLQDEKPTTTVLFVSQVRANRHKSELPGHMAKWEPDWTSAIGANATKHGKLIEVTLWSEGKERASKTDRRIVGKTVKWKVSKGKAGTRDNVFGEYGFNYAAPGDHYPHMLASGIQHGVVMERDGKITFKDRQTDQALSTPKGTPLENIQGIQGLKNLFLEEPEAEMAVRREILTAGGVSTCLYR
jgi:RecA/RadA recombinase